MSALATPTLEQPESTVTCRVLVQPHCGTLLQQHSKWTKKWGQDRVHISAKDLVDRVESKISPAVTWVGQHAGRVINFVEVGLKVACSFIPAPSACSLVAAAAVVIDVVRLYARSGGSFTTAFAKKLAYVVAKDALLAIPAKFGDKAISLSNEAGQLAFTRLQTAFIRISTASPQMVDQLASA